jgi:hypothetical protein
MKRGALAVVGVLVALGACDGGESTERATSVDPDQGGAAGDAGRGGTSHAGQDGVADAGSDVGGAGAGSLGPNDQLGQPCFEDADCAAPGQAELVCIDANDTTTLQVGAPSRGLCTFACESDADCEERAAGSLCHAFGAGGAKFCVEGCHFGEPPVDRLKCHGRDDFMCGPILVPTDEPCIERADCASDELCIERVCQTVLAGCVPRCRGDLDCGVDLYCDQSFDGGLCVEQKPVGKAFGEPCVVPDRPEDDECLGFCQADDETTGHCAVPCGLLNACAWNNEALKFEGQCRSPSILSVEVGARGDFAFCTATCNCREECRDSSRACQLPDGGELSQGEFTGRGLCLWGPDELDECSAGGAPSAGGAAP